MSVDIAFWASWLPPDSAVTYEARAASPRVCPNSLARLRFCMRFAAVKSSVAIPAAFAADNVSSVGRDEMFIKPRISVTVSRSAIPADVRPATNARVSFSETPCPAVLSVEYAPMGQRCPRP